ncbi:MAG: head-tail adaptor protein [Paracoccus sp. (in: a-proteobacteria)]|nr:head-tail adaptor protein [Paracoccus sp. (in: a-proteobacteria)]
MAGAVIPLVLESAEHLPDGMGGHLTTWRALGLLYGQMTATGRQAGPETVPGTALRWRITMRAHPPGDPRRPRPGQRLRMGGRVFRIETVAEAGPHGRHLDVMAQEEQQ